MLSSVRQEVFLHAPPCLEFVFQQLLKIWEPREPRRDPQEIDGDPRNCLGAPGTTLAYCRVKYSTFLISHSASLHLRQNYADWYIRESHTEGYWGITCLKPAAVIGYPWLDFLIAAPFLCFFKFLSSAFNALYPPHPPPPPPPPGRLACLLNKSWELYQNRYYEVYLRTIWGGANLQKLYCSSSLRADEKRMRICYLICSETQSLPPPRESNEEKAVGSGTKGRTGHVSTTLLIYGVNVGHRGELVYTKQLSH